ncbi:hypothetical protein [Carnimonas bestiolae]|uniref:hypothetical protein n=1 Tax=Carnimonas bestiolae TaxID=3402172 RepID=UPI003EDC053A
MIDTQAYAARLEAEDNLDPNVARVIARERYYLEDRAVTKSELREELTGLREGIRKEIAELETKLTVRMGIMWMAAVSVLAAMKFFS